MNNITCPSCGWTGGKYQLLVSLTDYNCPQCEKKIPDELVQAIEEKDKEESD